jgi:hypothetical protein
LLLKNLKRIRRRFLFTINFLLSIILSKETWYGHLICCRRKGPLRRLWLLGKLCNQSPRVCRFVLFHCSLIYFYMCVLVTLVLFVCLFTRKLPLRRPWSKADPKVVAVEAIEKTVDDIVIKICNDIYDEVMRG